MTKGLSATIGFLIFILILLTTLIPLAFLILSQSVNQQYQIQNIQAQRELISEQYHDVYSDIVLVYSSTSNRVSFLFFNTPVIPVIIKYLVVFNGTKWIYLNIIKEKGTLVAVPENADASLQINGNVTIQILGVRPYDNQSSYVVAVTQYGNIIYALPYSAPVNYYIFEGAIIPTLDLPYSYLKNISTPFGIVNYFNSSDAYLFWDGINSYKPYQYYNNGILYVNLNGSWFSTSQEIGSGFDDLPSDYVNLNLSTPVLELASSKVQYGGGEVFWNETYFANENISLEFIATYTAGDLGSGGGLVFYLFIQPNQWNLSSAVFNSSSLFPQNYNYTDFLQPLIFFPRSSAPYLVLTWSSSGWDLYIYNSTFMNNTSISFSPEPGNFILFKIAYIPRTDEIYAFAYDYNTSQESVAVFNLTNILYPFDSGNYAFGVASFNHGVASNWGIIYANVPALEPLFDPQLQFLFSKVF